MALRLADGVQAPGDASQLVHFDGARHSVVVHVFEQCDELLSALAVFHAPVSSHKPRYGLYRDRGVFRVVLGQKQLLLMWL